MIMSIDLKNIRFLVVEDQPQAMLLLTTILKELGAVEIYTASDGETALNLLGSAEDLFDIILCDWMMPRVSGFEVLQFVRSEKMDIPFVMITANVDAKSVMLARGTGVNAYITKPYSLENIVSTLGDIIRQM
jgi:CheY-like chemotaxis protein